MSILYLRVTPRLDDAELLRGAYADYWGWQLQQTGLKLYRPIFSPCWRRRLARAARGRVDSPGRSRDVVAATEERWWETELSRLQGELLCQLPRPAVGQAEACFQQAVDVARHQQAKALELRAAMSLARLWQRQGKRAEARELLAPIYAWFTEGFDITDLQEAKGLLDALA